MSSTETQWTKKVCEQLDHECRISDIPLVITPISASRLSTHGLPDRYFTSKIWRGLVEFKGIATPMRKTQIRFSKQQNLVVPYSCFVWRQVNDTLLVKLEYACKTYGDCPVSLGYGDGFSVLKAMGDIYDGNRSYLATYAL